MVKAWVEQPPRARDDFGAALTGDAKEEQPRGRGDDTGPLPDRNL